MYRVNNILNMNVTSLPGNIIPLRVLVFLSKNHLFHGRLELELRYDERVRKLLISNYGTPNIIQSRLSTACRWENEQSVLCLIVSMHNFMIEVIEANHYKVD